MLYNSLKIFHILSATLLLASLGFCLYIWKCHSKHFQQIQRITAMSILPLLLFQLVTGFSLINLKQYDLSEFWLKGSIISFVSLIICWFGFVYFLLSEQEVNANVKILRSIQSIMLVISIGAILSMVFFMANKI